MIRGALRLSRAAAFKSFPAKVTMVPMSRSLHFSRMVWNEKDAEAKPEETKAEEKEEKKEESKEKPKVKSPEDIIAEKDKEIEDWKKKYMSSLAEMQNLRTRTQNDVSNAKKYGAQEFAKSMIEVADTLTMAIAATRDDATGDNPKLKTFFDGVVMTESILLQNFEKNYVTKMEALDAKFDPNFHDGAFQYDDPEKVPGTVGQVVKNGYMLRDRVLRPAQVGTIKPRP